MAGPRIRREGAAKMPIAHRPNSQPQSGDLLASDFPLRWRRACLEVFLDREAQGTRVRNELFFSLHFGVVHVYRTGKGCATAMLCHGYGAVDSLRVR